MAEVELRVDANKLNKEATKAAQDEVFAGQNAERDGFGAALPKPPANEEGI